MQDYFQRGIRCGPAIPRRGPRRLGRQEIPRKAMTVGVALLPNRLLSTPLLHVQPLNTQKIYACVPSTYQSLREAPLAKTDIMNGGLASGCHRKGARWSRRSIPPRRYPISTKTG